MSAIQIPRIMIGRSLLSCHLSTSLRFPAIVKAITPCVAMRPLSSTLSRSYSTPTTQEPKTTSKPPTPSSPPSAEKSNPKHRTNQPPSQNHPSPPRLIKRILHIRRVARVNSGGKVRSVSALVVVGNGNGAAGYGEGRAVEVSAAVQKATRNAEKNMTYFERFNHRTIFSNIDFYWHRVRLQLRSAPPGMLGKLNILLLVLRMNFYILIFCF